MKTSNLISALGYCKEDLEVVVQVKLPYSTVGGTPYVTVKNANVGFDWDAGKFMIVTDESVTPSDRDFAAQMKKMQDDLGWAQYENRNLKSENKKLKKILEGVKSQKD